MTRSRRSGTRKARLQLIIRPEICAAIDDYQFATRKPNRAGRYQPWR